MRRNSDDDENPFGETFGGIDQLMTDSTGDETDRIDVYEYDDRIEVIADLTGADSNDIDLQCDGRKLAIRVSNEPRPFVQRVSLPDYVDDESMSTSFNNGVLEVTLDRTNDPANIGFY